MFVAYSYGISGEMSVRSFLCFLIGIFGGFVVTELQESAVCIYNGFIIGNIYLVSVTFSGTELLKPLELPE